MSFESFSSILERDDLPADVHKNISEAENYLDLLNQKICKLETVNTRLNDLLTIRNKEKLTLQNRLSFNAKTGLPNHHKVDTDLKMILEEANISRRSQSIIVYIIKLDENFNIVHKTSKASISEWIIYQIGLRIREELGTGSLLYHTRDDEFIVILRGITKDKAISRAAMLCRSINQPHIFSGYHISIGCRIGIAVYPEHGITKELILHNADIALDYAKRMNKEYLFFSDEMRLEVIEKMELQNSIIKALEEQALKEIDKQFELFYQPLVKISRNESREYTIHNVDCEALIRWNHPQKGEIAPSRFIPVAEETGLIMPIGNWVLYHAAEQLGTWKKEGNKKSVISINLSPRQFKDPYIVKNIERIFSSRDIDSSRLKLEITESCLMDDPVEAILKMNQLTRLGIKFCIDDFGTGYSSLNYLRKLPISTLKIDKSFIENMIKSSHDRAIIRAILSMSKEMEFDVIAEGVESQDQVEYLLSEGCSVFQGFYFAKALPVNEFDVFVDESLRN